MSEAMARAMRERCNGVVLQARDAKAGVGTIERGVTLDQSTKLTLAQWVRRYGSASSTRSLQPAASKSPMRNRASLGRRSSSSCGGFASADDSIQLHEAGFVEVVAERDQFVFELALAEAQPGEVVSRHKSVVTAVAHCIGKATAINAAPGQGCANGSGRAGSHCPSAAA